ncbi:MAG: hypothetical protein AB7D05_10965, partial [Mangrovibacterium sp.]
MEFIYEEIRIPEKRTFVTRSMSMDPEQSRIHSHRNFELNLITAGAGRRIVGNHISSYRKGDLVLLGPNLYHCWEVQEPGPEGDASCIVTHFSENIIHSGFFNIPELESVISLLQEAGQGIFFTGKKAARVAVSLEKMVK